MKSNGRVRWMILWRALAFLRYAEVPLTTTEVAKLLRLGWETNVYRYMRLFVELGIAEEAEKRAIHRGGRFGVVWVRTYRRKMRLVES